MTQHEGGCDCGVVTFFCVGKPLFTQYCHCNKCREIASLSTREADKSGYAHTAAYLKFNFKITSGSDKLYDITRNNATLLLCESCHSLIYGISVDENKQAGIGINVNNFYFQKFFNPVRHIWYSNRIVDVEDKLPKFKDTSEEQFGSGELFSEGEENTDALIHSCRT